MLEGAAHAPQRDLARGNATDDLAPELDGARCEPQHARDEVEGGGLARTVGPDEAHDLTGLDLEADVVHCHQTAKLLAHLLHIQHHLAQGGLAALGQGLSLEPGVHALRHREVPPHQAPGTIGQVLQHQHQHDAKHNHLVTAAGANELGQQHLQLVFHHLGEQRTGDGTPHMADSTQHRHEQVFNAHLQAKRRGVDRALKVRKQPARHAGEQRGNDEDAHLVLQCVHTHGLCHLRGRLQRADGAAGARIQQVQQRKRAQKHHAPHQDEEGPARAQVNATQAERGHAQNAVVLAQRVQVAHEVVQRQAPGNGCQRQIVARHAQRQPAHHECTDGGDGQPGKHRDPRRHPHVHREVGAGVGPDAHKRCLAEGGEPTHAGQQHQAHAHQAVKPDVVELRDPEIGQGQDGQRRDEQQRKVAKVLAWEVRKQAAHVSGPPRRVCR